MRTRRFGWIGLLLIAACIPETQLQPKPGTQSLAGNPSSAVADNSGVRLIADGNAWKGHPSNLERRLTPVQVRLENHSGRTLSVRYSSFDLVGGSSFAYAALSPMNLKDAAQPTCVTGFAPGYWGMNSYWGPRRGWRYGSPWRTPWWPSPFYDPFYGSFYGPVPYTRCDEPLPTQDMVNQALPEGRLENGGIVSGFLYFQGVGERESHVTLQARLVDANTGETFGQLTIPFEVRRD